MQVPLSLAVRDGRFKPQTGWGFKRIFAESHPFLPSDASWLHSEALPGAANLEPSMQVTMAAIEQLLIWKGAAPAVSFFAISKEISIGRMQTGGRNTTSS